MKKFIFIGIFIILKHIVFSQCNEYYINELIEGSNDDPCFYSSGSPIRFCHKLKGIAINGRPMDVYKWEGYETQYLTISQNGGIAGTVVLALDSKELIVNLNGCSSKKYSISLTESEYKKWLEDKPKREKEKEEKLLKQQEYEKNKKLNDEKIKNLIDANNLNNYIKTINSSIVNNAIENNEKFRKIIELADKDTLIYEFKDGRISKMNFNYDLDNYCQYLSDFKKTGEYRGLSYDEQDSIDRLSYQICRRENRSYYGYTQFNIVDFFPKNTFKHDTLIQNIRIPLNNFKIIIVKNKKQFYDVKNIFAPTKFEGQKLYLSKTPFTDKQNWAGYFTNKNIENFIDTEQSEKIKITYTEEVNKIGLAVDGIKYNLIYANNVFIGRESLGRQMDFYKFKKIK